LATLAGMSVNTIIKIKKFIDLSNVKS